VTDSTALHTGSDGAAAPSSSGRLPLRPRELVAVLAFWAFLAALTAASRLFDPRAPGLPEQVSSALVTLAVVEYAIWALLTVPILWLGSRLTIEEGNRLGRILALVVIGVAIALLVDTAVATVRAELFPFPRRRGPRPGPGPGFLFGGVLRLGFLDDLMVYLAVLAGGVARDYFLRYQARLAETVRLQAHAAQLQAQLAEARLAVLRAQLDPHFLFNTLHAVSALVERDPKGVRRMIARLSELLRHTLEGTGGGEQEVPLARELELVRRYVEIMEVRFQGRLEVATVVDDGVLGALVPTLVLQPLVENAIRHGASRVAGVGRLELRARREGDELVLAVRDNGPGPEGGEPAGAGPPGAGSSGGSSSGGGVGLRNTRERLAELYGARQRLTLRRDPDGWTAAEIALPFRAAPAASTSAASTSAAPAGSARAAAGREDG
jgi:hypothetical protein